MTTSAVAPHSRAFSFTILGGGAVATELHLPALRALDALDRTRVVEPSAEVLDRARNAFPAIGTEQKSFDAFLGTHRVDPQQPAIAIVALPNHLHAAGVEAALRSGFHVLCEKPLALERETCLRLAAAASDRRLSLAVGMVRRLLPSVRAVRAAIDDGLLGTLQRVEIEHGGAYAWPAASKAPFERRNGGVLADMGIHYLDLLDYLLGALTPVGYEDDYRGGVEANCTLRLVAGEALPVRIALSRTHTLANRWLLRGSKGEIELGVDQWESCTFRSHEGNKLEATLRLPQPFRSGPWQPTFHSCFVEQIEEFAGSIADGQRPAVTAGDAARTVALVEWAYAQRQTVHVAPARAPQTALRPTLAPARVVVTGGSGFIGQHLIDRLDDLGFDDIRVPVRSYRSCAGVARFDAELDRVDLLDRGQVDAALRGARHVFHLAYGRDGADAARITIEGTRNVIEAAIAAGAESVVVLSTMYVFGHPSSAEAVDETWPYQPTGGEYGTSKARMEKWCLERARTSTTTRIAVLNPSCVYGPGGGAYTALPARLTRNRGFCWINDGNGIANYCYTDNLVDAILLAAARPEAHGQRFLISDGSCTWREFLSPMLGEAWARRLPSYTAGELVAQPGRPRASVKELVSHLAGDLALIDIVNRIRPLGTLKHMAFRRAPNVRGALIDLRAPEQGPAIVNDTAELRYPPRWLADLYGPTRTRFTSAKAQRVLGWKPLVVLADGQARAHAWLRETSVLPVQDPPT